LNKLGIGIPIYKDLDSLKDLITEIQQCPNLPIDFYILDHGSNEARLTEFLSSLKIPNVQAISSKENFGFGGGIKYLIQNMDNELVGWMPGNGKVRPKDLQIVVDAFKHQAIDYAFKANRDRTSKIEDLKTVLAGVAVSAWFQTNLMDSGGTPTVVKREIVQDLQAGPNDFSFEAFVMFRLNQLGIKIIRAKVPYGSRVKGKSHWQRGFKSEMKLLLRILEQRKDWKNLKPRI
jgi:hypothetical protein